MTLSVSSTYPAPPRAWPAWVAALVCAGVTVAFLGFVFHNYPNQDVAAHLKLCEWMVDGGVLYRDICEYNLPSTHLLHLGPVMLARAMGVPPEHVFHVMLILLALYSLAMYRKLWPGPRPAGASGLALDWAFMLFVLLVSAGFDFGQREHLFLLLSWPYFFLVADRAQGRPVRPALAVIVGLAAGVGFVVKPFFPLPWAALEIYLFFRLGWRKFWKRPEPWLVGLVGLSLLLYLVLLKPEYFVLVRDGMASYWAYDRSIWDDFFIRRHVGWLAAVSLFPVLFWRFRGEALLQVWYLALVVLGLMALGQGKSFPYHWIPDKAAVLLFLYFALCRWQGERPRFNWLVACLVLAASLAMGGRNLHEAWAHSPTNPSNRLTPLAELLKEKARGKVVYFMSTAVMPAFPLLNVSQAKWRVRYHFMWPLPAQYKKELQAGAFRGFHSPAHMSPLEKKFFNGVARDLLANPPALIVVDRHQTHQALGRVDFDFWAYFKQSPGLKPLFAQYEPLARMADFEVFERRSTGKAAGKPEAN